MDTQVTLTLSEDLYEYAKRWAAITQQDLSDMITSALTIVLTPVHTVPKWEKPVTLLSDEDVLALSQAQMELEQGQRLSNLLGKQREGILTEDERPELLALMQVYDQLWIRQSEALAEAVRRGLRKSLDP